MKKGSKGVLKNHNEYAYFNEHLLRDSSYTSLENHRLKINAQWLGILNESSTAKTQVDSSGHSLASKVIASNAEKFLHF